MSVTTIANRYARALADVITERGEMNVGSIMGAAPD